MKKDKEDKKEKDKKEKDKSLLILEANRIEKNYNNNTNETNNKNKNEIDYNMIERPVIHFNTPNSHIQLSPLKDIQSSWTVEFWIKREVPTVSYTESLTSKPEVKSSEKSQNYSQNNSQGLPEKEGEREGYFAGSIGAEVYSLAFPKVGEGKIDRKPLQSLHGYRGSSLGGYSIEGSGSGSGMFGVGGGGGVGTEEQLQRLKQLRNQQQSSYAKLSQILGADFHGMLEGRGSRIAPGGDGMYFIVYFFCVLLLVCI